MSLRCRLGIHRPIVDVADVTNGFGEVLLRHRVWWCGRCGKVLGASR